MTHTDGIIVALFAGICVFAASVIDPAILTWTPPGYAGALVGTAGFAAGWVLSRVAVDL